MLVGAEALRILVSRHQHLIHSRSPHSVPTKVLLPVALCCASQVSGGRGTQTSLFSSLCWTILLRDKSFSMRPCFKGDEFYIIRSLPSSTWTGNVGFQVGAVGDGSQDFSSKVSVLPSISTEQMLFCRLDDLRQAAEVADFLHSQGSRCRSRPLTLSLGVCSNSGALLVLNTSSLSHNRRFFLTKADL